MFSSSWESYKSALSKLKHNFQEFQLSNCGNENFMFWNVYLLEIFPILRDFELPVRKGDFNLYLAAIRRSLPLFFATGRSNYSRWGPLFYQDCLDLQRKFPDLYRHFKNGYFVCRMTNRSNSCI